MRRRWFSRRAILLHLALLFWVPGCLAAGWWQATVALSGNGLSYLYAVEWPAFALFGAIGWWNFLHDDPDSVGSRGLRRAVERSRSGSAAPDDCGTDAPELVSLRAADEDEDLAAYNDYLARLAAESRSKTWRSR